MLARAEGEKGGCLSLLPSLRRSDKSKRRLVLNSVRLSGFLTNLDFVEILLPRARTV